MKTFQQPLTAGEEAYYIRLLREGTVDYCKEGQHSPNWYFASEDVLKLYMDPRNSLQENAIFQFEQLTYNASYHTEEAVKNFLEGTFMNSSQNLSLIHI